ERGNDPVRISVMTNAQQTYGNRAVQRFLQRRAAGSVPVQRDDSNLPPTPDVTLPTPSLLQPVDLLKQYGLLGDFQYKLDPRTEAQMRQYVQLRTDITPLQAAAQSFKPSATAAPSGQPAPGGNATP